MTDGSATSGNAAVALPSSHPRVAKAHLALAEVSDSLYTTLLAHRCSSEWRESEALVARRRVEVRGLEDVVSAFTPEQQQPKSKAVVLTEAQVTRLWVSRRASAVILVWSASCTAHAALSHVDGFSSSAPVCSLICNACSAEGIASGCPQHGSMICDTVSLTVHFANHCPIYRGTMTAALMSTV